MIKKEGKETPVYGAYVAPKERMWPLKEKWKAEVVSSPIQTEDPRKSGTIFKKTT